MSFLTERWLEPWLTRERGNRKWEHLGLALKAGPRVPAELGTSHKGGHGNGTHP